MNCPEFYHPTTGIITSRSSLPGQPRVAEAPGAVPGTQQCLMRVSLFLLHPLSQQPPRGLTVPLHSQKNLVFLSAVGLWRGVHPNLSQGLALLAASTNPPTQVQRRGRGTSRRSTPPYTVTLIPRMISNYTYVLKMHNCLFQGGLEAA